MFYLTSVKKVKATHDHAIQYYNASLEELTQACEDLYEVRCKSDSILSLTEELVNSIANSPKELRTELEKVEESRFGYQENLNIAREQAAALAEAGIGVAAATAAGGVFAAGVPKAALSIASVFGKATTGKAISELSGYAAYKASAGWLARMTVGKVAPKLIVGSGFAQGEAMLALAGPIGIAIGTATTAVSLARMSVKNKKTIHASVKEIQDIMKSRDSLCKRKSKVDGLKAETLRLMNSVRILLAKVEDCRDSDYRGLQQEKQFLLGTLVNSALALAKVLTYIVED